MLDVSSAFRSPSVLLGLRLDEGLQLTPPLTPFVAPRVGHTAITMRGQGFQRSPHLVCHTVLLAKVASQLAGGIALPLGGVNAIVAQSFTGDRTGTLQQLSLWLQMGSGGTWLALTIRDGDQPGGTILASQQFHVEAPTVLDTWVEVVLERPPQLYAGSRYCLTVGPATATSQSLVSWVASSAAPYSAGMAFQNATSAPQYDMTFKVFLSLPSLLGASPGGSPSIIQYFSQGIVPAVWHSDNEVVCMVAQNEQAALHPYGILRVSNDGGASPSGQGVPFRYQVCDRAEAAMPDISYIPSTTQPVVLSAATPGGQGGLAQRWVSNVTGDLTAIEMFIEVKAGATLRLSVGEGVPTGPCCADQALSTQEVAIDAFSSKFFGFFLDRFVAVRAGGSYWVALQHVSGGAITLQWAPSTNSQLQAYTSSSAAPSTFTAPPSRSFVFRTSVCEGCGIEAPAIPRVQYLEVGVAVNDTVVGEPATEKTRSAAAQSFTAVRTALISELEIFLEVPDGGVYGRSLLCLWLSSGGPQGSHTATEVPDGNKCFEVVAGTSAWVTVVFDRAPHVSQGLKYFITLRHGKWYPQDTIFAAIPNAQPLAYDGSMEPALLPTAPARWRGGGGNPYWPGQHGLPGEAMALAPGGEQWELRKDEDLAFRYSYCVTGQPMVLNISTGYDHVTYEAIARSGCCVARSSSRHGAKLILTGVNFFPSYTMRCVFYSANHTVEALTEARPLDGSLTLAECPTPNDYDPYTSTSCTNTSCLGSYVTITADTFNFVSVAGSPQATLGALTRKLLISDIYVSSSGRDDSGGDGSKFRPYNSLMRAIRAANQFDRIAIMGGSVLTGSRNKDLKHLGKDIVIRVESNEGMEGETALIDCEGSNYVTLPEEQQAQWQQTFPQNMVAKSTDGHGIRFTTDVLFRGCSSTTTVVTI